MSLPAAKNHYQVIFEQYVRKAVDGGASHDWLRLIEPDQPFNEVIVFWVVWQWDITQGFWGTPVYRREKTWIPAHKFREFRTPRAGIIGTKTTIISQGHVFHRQQMAGLKNPLDYIKKFVGSDIKPNSGKE